MLTRPLLIATLAAGIAAAAFFTYSSSQTT